MIRSMYFLIIFIILSGCISHSINQPTQTQEVQTHTTDETDMIISRMPFSIYSEQAEVREINNNQNKYDYSCYPSERS